MVTVKPNSLMRYLFRGPVYLYRWHLGWLFGRRLLLLTHTGRRTGLRRQTVLEVVEYRQQGPEVVVANGFGPNCDWVRNIEATPTEEVTVASQHFVAAHRYLGEEEAVRVMQDYEHRNRFIAPVVRAGSELAARLAISWQRQRAPASGQANSADRVPPAIFRGSD